MGEYSNTMSEQVMNLPKFIEDQYDDLEPKARTVMSFEEIFNVQRIIITGCGDSLAAGMAIKYAFEMLTDIPTEAVTAIELSRFYAKKQLGTDSRNPLIIAVSNSGLGARVTEAIKRGKKYGAFILGVTGNKNSPLYENSDKVLKLDIPKIPSAPGTISYMVSVMSLLLLAIRFGEVRLKYTMDEAMDYRYDIRAQGKMLRELLPSMDEVCLEISKKWKDFQCYDFIGAGFDYATAWFGHAKILETSGAFAMHINSEEWFHLNFFAKNKDELGTIVIANTTNPGHSRNKELVKYANVLKRPLVVITDGDKSDFNMEEATYIKVPMPKHKINMPLTHFVPICLIASYIAKLNDEQYGRGLEGEWSFAQGGKGVTESEIIVY